MKHDGRFLAIGAFLLLDLALLSAWLSYSPRQISPGGYPEIRELQAGERKDFKELAKYFKELAENKGAEYAFRVLATAPIPPNVDMHLMGHIVGDELFKQRGAEGIKICTDDFRNACSHAIVVGLFLEKGAAALPEIVGACREAPGGRGAYTMCFHGLGHGILAYAGYDLKKAVRICEDIAKEANTGREDVECVGGTVMEILGGGFHDRELYKKQAPKYVRADDPLYPCTADFMPEKARGQCYNYLTPHLFTAAGGNLGSLSTKSIEAAFPFCDRIPKEEVGNRIACFGGFGKEFVVLAKARDVRNIDKMTPEELGNVRDWCLLGKTDEGILACMNTAAASLYWGGENDPGAVITFCGLLEGAHRESCYANLFGAVSFYVQDRSYRESFCGKVPQDFRNACAERLLAQASRS